MVFCLRHALPDPECRLGSRHSQHGALPCTPVAVAGSARTSDAAIRTSPDQRRAIRASRATTPVPITSVWRSDAQ